MRRAHPPTLTILALVLALLSLATEARAQARPIALEELEEVVRSGAVAQARVIALVRDRCVAFTADEASARRLREAGATEPVLAAVREACRVLPGEPRWVRIVPPSAEVRVGATAQFKAVALAPDSSEIANPLLRWTSSNPALARVSADGRVTGQAPGVAFVTAIATNGMTAGATVLVTGPLPSLARKSTGTAIALGTLVPGGGQFYVGQGFKGGILFTGSVATAVVGLAVTTDKSSVITPDPDCLERCAYTITHERNRPAVIPTLIAAAGLWAYGIVDAAQQARATQTARRPGFRLFGGALLRADGMLEISLFGLRY